MILIDKEQSTVHGVVSLRVEVCPIAERECFSNLRARIQLWLCLILKKAATNAWQKNTGFLNPHLK